jgi:ribonuclease-3
MEAVIAAVHLDGGFEAARALILALWGPRIGAVEADARDAKTALQEWAAARSFATPAYEIIGQSGPDHAPEFTVQLTVQGRKPETGVAGSRRMAEQNAAEAFLIREKIWK